MNRKKVILGPGCIDCPVKECDTITYRGSRCEVLRDKYNLDDPDKDRALTIEQICMLHHKSVLVKAPEVPDIDEKVMICDGCRKEPSDGAKYVILDDEQYSYGCFIDGTIILIPQ